jgi:membrane-associated phospholipid phosphatase
MHGSWRNTLLLAAMLLCPVAAAAQTLPADAAAIPQASPAPQASTSPSLERQFFRNILRDQLAIITSPLHLKQSDAKFLLPIGAATAVLIGTDRRTAAALGNNQTRLTVSRDISRLGEFYTTGGIATAFYIAGRAGGSARARETGLLAGEALIDSGIDVQALKAITQRPRPLQDNGRARFFTRGNSFPSGHAISAWSLATVVADEYHDRPVVRFGAYGLATAVSLSRYTGRNHFLSDVFVGSALGYGIGHYVYKTHHNTKLDSTGKNKTQPKQHKLLPLISTQYSRRARVYGTMLVWSF